MAKQEVDYKKVAEAADKILASGIEPSVTDLCKELGLVSTPRNLSQLLEKWYHSRPDFKRVQDTPLTENISLKHTKKNQDLEKTLSLVRATLECTADGIMMVNGKGAVVDWNQKFCEMWRIPTHLMEAGPEKLSFDYILAQLINPEKLIADVQFLYANPEWQGELPELHFKDGRIFERYTQPQRIGKEIVGRVYSFRDVTEKRIASDELRIRERAVEASTHGIVIIDISNKETKIIYVNTAFEHITGYDAQNVLGKPINFIYSSVIDEADKKKIDIALREGREATTELQLNRNNGHPFWSELGIAPVKNSFDEIKHFVFIINDITRRKEMEEQLIKQATHDALTDLPNRVLLTDRVDQAILQAKKNKSLIGFIFLDLDRFKMINDTLGHGMGDKLLQMIANKLLIATNDFDTVARFGGDEFVVLLPNLHDFKEAEYIAQEILDTIQTPIKIDNHQLKITASLGISFYPRDGDNYETLMKNADLSMYYAKDRGRNTYCVFEAEMTQRIVNYSLMDNAIKGALKNKEFYLVYQPLIDLHKNKIKGFEALIRWNNPQLGHVSPAEFIPIAEENGVILEIGQWVLEEACKQLLVWHSKGYKNYTMAVNVSGRQLHQAQLPEYVREVLEKTGLKPNFLELELTESLLVENVQNAIELMHRFKDIGVRLAIDDFGTGYSSLSYLKQFPLDKLKIDKSFIREMTINSNDAAIVKAIIDLGHSLNLEVLAEGVETLEEKKFIMANGCNSAQGYYYSQPLKPNDMDNFLENFDKMHPPTN